ncbi:MAG: NAD(+)/NADH kinase [Actinobacteria bacterium]|nr:NAD(+)/NADH kinase [Actinomycetota bacterium]
MTPTALRAVGLVPHRDRNTARELAHRAAGWLAEHGVEVRVPAPDAVGFEKFAVEASELGAGVDLVVSFGGDGTMLRAVDLAVVHGVPVLGVNAGQMGYLTEVEPAALDEALGRLVAGDYAVTERMVLQVTVDSNGPAAGKWWALNEAVLEKPHPGRLARLDVVINGSFFTSYAADGVIVATPTGSTAYSFSARGPIVSPRLRCMLLTPVSPHMLFDRSLVLDGDEELVLTVSGDRPVLLTLDGRELGELETGARAVCTGGPRPARIVTFGPRDFHQILKAKFGLPDR